MIDTSFPIVTVIRDAQPQNADSPIFVTLSGISIDVRLLQLKKANQEGSLAKKLGVYGKYKLLIIDEVFSVIKYFVKKITIYYLVRRFGFHTREKSAIEIDIRNASFRIRKEAFLRRYFSGSIYFQ